MSDVTDGLRIIISVSTITESTGQGDTTSESVLG